MTEDSKSADGSSRRSDGLVDQTSASPRPAAVTFATTEHFTLQGSRAATISESYWSR